MKVFVDECVDWRLSRDIVGHDVKTRATYDSFASLGPACRARNHALVPLDAAAAGVGPVISPARHRMNPEASPEKTSSPVPFYVIAAIGGATLWLVTMAISGRNEAWDSPLYWQAAYPLAIALAGLLGYLAPQQPWRWALTVMWVQPVVMVFTSGGSFGLLPLGLILFAILAVPPIIAAQLAARLRKRNTVE